MEATGSLWPSDLIIWTLIGTGVKRLTLKRGWERKKKENKGEGRERDSKPVVSLPHAPSMRILISSLGQTRAQHAFCQHFFNKEMLIHKHAPFRWTQAKVWKTRLTWRSRTRAPSSATRAGSRRRWAAPRVSILRRNQKRVNITRGWLQLLSTKGL